VFAGEAPLQLLSHFLIEALQKVCPFLAWSKKGKKTRRRWLEKISNQSSRGFTRCVETKQKWYIDFTNSRLTFGPPIQCRAMVYLYYHKAKKLPTSVFRTPNNGC